VFAFTPLTADDLPFLLEIRNECRDSLHDNRVFNLQDCQTWFRSTRPEFYLIWLGSERIGYFRVSNFDRASRTVYVGADLHSNYRGKGLAYDAYREFLQFLAQRYQLDAVRLEVLSHNRVAHHLYQKLGFVETGRQNDFGVRDGRAIDSIVMELRLPNADVDLPREGTV
jgi:RimJ/RimL family protein N-acetyltransferase